MGDADGRWWWTLLEFDAMAYLPLRPGRVVFSSDIPADLAQQLPGLVVEEGLTSDSTW